MKTVAIIGAGAGGLSILWKIKQSSLAPLHILVFDPDPDGIAQRNWCQWVKPQERMPYHGSAWHGIRCRTPRGSYDHVSREWLYVRTTGGDYRKFIEHYDAGAHRIEWHTAKVQHVWELPDKQRQQVVTDQGTYEVDMVFNSRPTQVLNPRLWQHFHGWHIEVDAPIFDPTRVTLMDFDVPQLGDGVTFFYVLPYSERSALVECTVFSSQIWEKEQYEAYLKDYLLDRFGIAHGDLVRHTIETGQIPMDTSKWTDPKKKPVSNLEQQSRVNSNSPTYWSVGAEAGAIKPSTGYAFTRIQAMASHLIHTWETKGYPEALPLPSRRFRWYDALLLGIIRERPDQVVTIFDRLFCHIPIDRTFRFLDEGSSLADEVGIFWHLPKRTFLRQACKHVIS
jgi:lycopene beta-cyclase